MKLQTIIYITLILIILTVLGLFIATILKNPQDFQNQETPDNTNQIKTTNQEETTPTGTSSNRGGNSATGGSSEETRSNEDESTLPEDLETRACGFYFEGYEYCGGTCPSGTCQQDGRSCYCNV